VEDNNRRVKIAEERYKAEYQKILKVPFPSQCPRKRKIQYQDSDTEFQYDEISNDEVTERPQKTGTGDPSQAHRRYEHSKDPWMTCYDNDCWIHLLEKKNAKWFPTKVAFRKKTEHSKSHWTDCNDDHCRAHRAAKEAANWCLQPTKN
jgi:hypothetical protein